MTYGDYVEMNQEDETGVPLRFCNDDNINSLKSHFSVLRVERMGRIGSAGSVKRQCTGVILLQ